MLSCVVWAADAQSWQIGVKGGISVPRLRSPSGSSQSLSGGYQTILGPQAGVVAEYRTSDRFSLQAEVNYSTHGGEKHGDQYINTQYLSSYIPSGFDLPTDLYARFNSKIELAYLELPLLAKYSLPAGKRVRLSVFGGPYIGYLLQATGSANGKSRIYTDPNFNTELTIKINNTETTLGEVDFGREEDILDQLNRLNYGIQAGGSVGYSISNFEIFMAAGGTYGFKRLQKDQNFGDNQTGAVTLCVGVFRKL